MNHSPTYKTLIRINIFQKKYAAWIPAILIAVTIFALSHQPGDESTVTSDNFSQVLLDFANELKMIDLNHINLKDMYLSMGTPVRKSAHAIEFAALDITLLFALYFWDMRGKEWLRTSFLLTTLYACSDELHQLLVPGRAGLVTDVIIDSLGTILVTIAVSFLIKRHQRKIH